MISIKIKKNLAGLDYLEKNLPKEVDASSKEVAQAIVDHIKSNWSASSPSNPGEPPAVVTGTLDASVNIDSTGRTLGGQFTSGKADLWVARVSALHGLFLEGGTRNMAARPFVKPAANAVWSKFPDYYKNIFKVVW